MTEYSVGNRVLVPGVVAKTDEWMRPGEVKVDLGDGFVAWLSPDDLRPDTGGRDLTAHDVRDVMPTYGWGASEFVAERLNRIARGDRPSGAGDDTAPPAYLALDVWQALGLPIEEFSGYYERNGWAETWAALMSAIRGPATCGRDTDGEPCVLAPHSESTPCHGASDVGSSEPLPAAAGPAEREALIPSIEWALFGSEGGCLVRDDSEIPVGELRRLLREAWAAAGPRAGDDERTVYELLVPPPPPEGVTEVRPTRWSDGPWRRDGDEWVRKGVRKTWAELVRFYPRGVEVVTRAGDTVAPSLGAAGRNLENEPCPGTSDGQHRWGTGRSRNECDECDAPRPNAAAGPRAGGTTPDDEVIATLKSAYDHACADWRQRADELVAERDAARSEAAELRAVGNKLADKAELSSGVDVRACVAAWRSAAGSPATDETGDGQ